MITSMVATIKQRVTVEAGGRIAVQSAELREGEAAEVIVIVERPSEVSAAERLGALNELRKSLNLTIEAASGWEADIQAERAAWRTPTAQG
jgi:hypothetical protein